MRVGDGVRVREEAMGKGSRARPRSGGSVKAARQCAIAPQQGDGDWETSIRGLDPFPSGVRGARKGIYEVGKQMMAGSQPGWYGGRTVLESEARLKPPVRHGRLGAQVIYECQ